LKITLSLQPLIESHMVARKTALEATLGFSSMQAQEMLLHVGVLASRLDMCLLFTVSSPLHGAMNVGHVVVQNVPGAILVAVIAATPRKRLPESRILFHRFCHYHRCSTLVFHQSTALPATI
jgi:hypothetical protein